MLGETPPNSTEPYRIKTCVLYFHPKDKYKHYIDVTNWSNSSDDRHTNTYISEAWATDLAGADLSVDVGLLSDAVLQVRDVGL